MIGSGTKARQETFLDGLSPDQIFALRYLFEFWALPHQIPPQGPWRTWVILGGRGAGKTRAGAEWVRAQVEGPRPEAQGLARRVALIGETFDQARDVMVFGESGILSCTPPDRRPAWEAGRKRLLWPNGAIAQIFSAFEPEALRGPQFDAAWSDEFAKWRKAEATWDMLQFALRIGPDPRQIVTTTPRNVPGLKSLLLEPSTVSTHATTFANSANLAATFLDEVQRRYKGTFLGKQELDGVLVDDIHGALWSVDTLENAHSDERPEFTRIVVAIDPPASSSSSADECGIIVAGACTDGPPDAWTGYVLADRSLAQATPTAWARAAISAYHEFGADRLVAEVNQGGELIENVLRQVDPMVPYKALRATRDKSRRAEPVAALYEQGRVRHLGRFEALEDQMRLLARDRFHGTGSPDRVDALVWAIFELMISPARSWRDPKVRTLV